MERAAFLDTGVILAYCFTADKHHYKCKEYLEQDGYRFFSSPSVEEEYRRKEPVLADRYSDGVFEHIADLKRANFEGQLDSMDVADIRDTVLNRKNPAYAVLYQFYRNHVPQFILVDELEEELRELARSIDQNAFERKEEVSQMVDEWKRLSEHPSIESKLSRIHKEDREVCVDAHDLADARDWYTELATTNPKHFVRDGMKELILEVTEIDNVISLAVTR